MANRVNVDPHMLRWARRRSGREIHDLAKSFPKLAEWEAGRLAPTMRQLEDYARATHTPVGFLFLPEPPEESLPIADLRTLRDQSIQTPSPDLLDTIYACEERQEWYRDFAIDHGYDPVALVGSLSLEDDAVDAAAQVRDTLGFDLARRARFTNWTDALGKLAERIEDIGVLVMINGVVGANTHRKLNPEEFRGFALVDEYAPVIFINGADTKAAQIFTLAHELAHVALGLSAVSRPDLKETDTEDNDTERWCNRLAAELLVPLSSLTTEYASGANLTKELDRLARFYRVSTLVILRRIHDAGFIQRDQFQRAYDAELKRVLDLAERTSTGGNFYNSTPVRVSKTFARALITDTTEGRTLRRDAYRLLGSKKTSTFEELGQRLGVA